MSVISTAEKEMNEIIEARSSVVEHCFDVAGASGSIPLAPTIRLRLTATSDESGGYDEAEGSNHVGQGRLRCGRAKHRWVHKNIICGIIR